MFYYQVSGIGKTVYDNTNDIAELKKRPIVVKIVGVVSRRTAASKIVLRGSPNEECYQNEHQAAGKDAVYAHRNGDNLRDSVGDHAREGYASEVRNYVAQNMAAVKRHGRYEVEHR